ncbi:MAG: AbrB/MazE/SpoVT family DNA-binding domain-containing protein [Candidatus Aenigmarchaeota archaeon]|nr:AbrB/MazE/SpoVT family DNA-binding domain-containing protein [Candidatus Aenigmarchaeota archaeon]
MKIDKKWRIVLPKQVRKNIRLKQSQRFRLQVDKDSIVLKKLKDDKAVKEVDPFLNDIRNPIHVDPKKLKKIDLKKIEEEMWLP